MASVVSSPDLIISSFRLQQNGLTPIGKPTFDEWISCGRFIKDAEQSVQFWIGDWLLFGEKTYGKVQYEQAIQQTGLDLQTLRTYKWVASSVPTYLRRYELSYHHHKEVANLNAEKQTALLDKAVTESWPLLKLKQEKYRLNLEAARGGVAADPGFLLGDCTNVLETLPDNSLDLLLTDPPYGIDYESEHREVNPFEKLENDHLEETLQVLSSTLRLASRKLKENSHVYIFTSWKTYPSVLPIVENYFTVKNLLVWQKNHWSQGDLTANYGQVHEFILFAHKGRRHLNGRLDGSVLHFDRVPENGRVHPTEKPLPLLEYLIEKSSQPGEVVCDPFAGVGSTCVAAKNKGRKYLGIEIDTQWYEKGLERLAA